MESQQRIEQIVVIVLLVGLAAGCLTVLRPFLAALLWDARTRSAGRPSPRITTNSSTAKEGRHPLRLARWEFNIRTGVLLIDPNLEARTFPVQ